MCACACGCTKVENRDLQLCASCNKQRRLGEKEVVVKERQPLRPVSAKRTLVLKERVEAYKVVREVGKWCLACGTMRNLTPSHVLTQKQFPQHAANPLNIVVLCGDCHSLWENNKTLFRELCPEVWKVKLQIMQALEPDYLERFKDKHL